jgi:protease-4
MANQPSPVEPESRPTGPQTAGPSSSPQSPQVIYVQTAAQPGRRWFSWLGWMAFFIALSVIMGMATQYRDYFDNSGGIREKFHSGEETGQAKIAIIEVNGIIASANPYVKRQIDRVREDSKVKAVVLRVDSPGGTITGSDYIYHHLLELRKERDLPLVVSMGGIATSGGYYVAMAVGDEAQTIYAEPTTTTGSIGVIIPHYDLSGLLERLDVKDDSLASHPRKRILSMTRSMSTDDRGVLEAYLQDAFTRFKTVVKSGRPAYREDAARLDELATGEIFTAVQAKEKGLVDELGFLESAIERAAELADLSEGSYRVVAYESPLSILNVLGVASSRSESSRPWQALLELSVPKAYYLPSSLHALAGLAAQ